ncbi:hypothetical protein K439DRAFT_1612156 [Ramaria rubella]|nr:hypothetical protein K439DRAFT_1612156 [Ramaria rubella]
MRLITIVSFLVATAHVAISAPVYSITRRDQGGVGAVIPVIPSCNGAVHCDYNEEEDIHGRQLSTLLARKLLRDGPNGLFRRGGSSAPTSGPFKKSVRPLTAGSGRTSSNILGSDIAGLHPAHFAHSTSPKGHDIAEHSSEAHDTTPHSPAESSN